MTKTDPLILDLLDFLDNSPTAFHAVDSVCNKLLAADFIELLEIDAWKLDTEGKYFVRHHGSVVAFEIPKSSFEKLMMLASHTDSPTFKLKPNAEFRKENMTMLGVEVYGAPILTSWLNRDLGIAGKIAYTDSEGTIHTSLVNLADTPVIIPQLAIHLDRNVNEQGLILNKQDNLSALASLTNSDTNNYLETLLKTKISFKKLLSHDLFLYPLEGARLIGLKQEMISSYRIDSLTSVHAALIAFLQSKPCDDLKMIVFWDHEEIGSDTENGANSPFVRNILERISIATKMSREEHLRMLRNSLCVSIDLAHALNPNYIKKHDPLHAPLINKGIVLKSNAQQRYASNVETSGVVIHACDKLSIPLQKFLSRSDMPCGSTIGPIHATATGIPTVDIGCAQLSMHSCREVTGCQDHLDMIKLLSGIMGVVNRL